MGSCPTFSACWILFGHHIGVAQVKGAHEHIFPNSCSFGVFCSHETRVGRALGAGAGAGSGVLLGLPAGIMFYWNMLSGGSSMSVRGVEAVGLWVRFNRALKQPGIPTSKMKAIDKIKLAEGWILQVLHNLKTDDPASGA